MTYTVYAKGIAYYEMEIEADNEEDAMRIAETTDYDDFGKPVDGDFQISYIEDPDGNQYR